VILEVLRIDESWSKKLYNFMTKYEHQGTFKYLTRRDHFIQHGHVIVCTDDGEIIQALFCEFEDGVAQTRAIYGEYGEYTIDMLDLLCAYCSSSYPVIEDHCFVITHGTYEKFRDVYDRSRLGGYTAMIVEALPFFKTKIVYPTI
jgi:hypothetical protein